MKSLCFLKNDYTGGRTVGMTGIDSIKTHTLFLVGNYGDWTPAESFRRGHRNTFFLTCTITRAQP